MLSEDMFLVCVSVGRHTAGQQEIYDRKVVESSGFERLDGVCAYGDAGAFGGDNGSRAAHVVLFQICQ